MKKTMVYILALSMAFSALLAGCGENKNNRPNANPTGTPTLTDQPTTMTPDPDDGTVNDNDGIITDNDNGPLNTDDPVRAGVNDLENDVKKAGDKLEDAGDKVINDITGNGTKNP